MKYRVFMHIRARGMTPFDSREFRSEDYESYEEFAVAVYDSIIDNIGDYEENEDDTDNDT